MSLNTEGIECSPISKRTSLFRMFPVLVLLSFWQKQHVDKDEYEALMKRYGQGKTKDVGEKAVPHLLSPSTISHGLAWDRTQDIVVTVQRLTASSVHGLKRQ